MVREQNEKQNTYIGRRKSSTKAITVTYRDGVFDYRKFSHLNQNYAVLGFAEIATGTRTSVSVIIQNPTFFRYFELHCT